MKMMARNRQRGAVLPVSLFILVICTILVVSSVETGSVGQQIAFSQQSQMLADLATQQRIEQVLSDPDWFQSSPNNWADAANPVETNTVTINNFTVVLTKPDCIGAQPAAGYSASIANPPEETYFDMQIDVRDTVSGTQLSTNQGVLMRMPAGACENPL